VGAGAEEREEREEQRSGASIMQIMNVLKMYPSGRGVSAGVPRPSWKEGT
jgi:hypothetical protein